jgi:hypothetical protein
MSVATDNLPFGTAKPGVVRANNLALLVPNHPKFSNDSRAAHGPRQPHRTGTMKADCANSISTILTNTAHWRTGLDQRWPDHRNLRASKQLAKLAGEASGMTDAQFESLRPFVGSPAWHVSLREVARLLGFAVRKMSFDYFVRRLAGLLSAPVASGP